MVLFQPREFVVTLSGILLMSTSSLTTSQLQAL